MNIRTAEDQSIETRVKVRESFSIRDHSQGPTWQELAYIEKECTDNRLLRHKVERLHLKFGLKAESQPLYGVLLTGFRWKSNIPEDVVLDFSINSPDRTSLVSTDQDNLRNRNPKDKEGNIIPSVPGSSIPHLIAGQGFSAIVHAYDFQKLVLWGRTMPAAVVDNPIVAISLDVQFGPKNAESTT